MTPMMNRESMMPKRAARLLITALTLATGMTPMNAQKSGYPVTPVLFTDVQVRDEFWSRRLETNRTVSIPYAFRQCEETGRVRNFEIADSVLRGAIAKGTFCTRYGFDDSDVFKIIEGAAYAIHTRYDAALDGYVDSTIAKIAAAQEPDGYLYTMRTIDAEKSWAKERWVNDRTKSSHELYNVGHLYEAAVAHHHATEKRTLLEIALKNADLLVATFGPGKMHTVPGHQVTEIGLAKLYVLTGKREYLDLAKFFIEERGRGVPQGESYNQDHRPILDETEAVGHAVRAGYFYAGMADVAALTGDDTYIRVLDRIWEDVVTKKMYVTGGVGAVGTIEGYGPPYVLPNLSAYCETCAGIALVYWNHRMFLRHGDAKYMDVVERVIYNGFLSGVSMNGDRFFYPNPLKSMKGAERSPWFACACCPSNDVRFVPSIPGYIYAHKGDELFVNLFIGGSATVSTPSGPVTLTQKGRYPWDGALTIEVAPSTPRSFTLNVRIPGWARNEPVPGDLYVYADRGSGPSTVKVNGAPIRGDLVKGYLPIARRWAKGDLVTLELPMPVRRVRAHARVEDDRGKVALERGPLVFCLEGADNAGGHVVNLVIPDSARITSEFRADLLNGVQILKGRALSVRRTLQGARAVEGPQEFVAIPYYAWAHRGLHQMTVWPAREVEAAKPLPAPTIAFQSNVTTSGGRGADALNDQLEARSSNDDNVPRFHWWPKKGSLEWVQYDFGMRRKVSRASVYWFDDTGVGECRVPKQWRVLYRSGTEWVPVQGATGYGLEKDKANTVSFAPVETDALRLEIQLAPDVSAGLYEWAVE
jgi:hypothetical protein